MRLKTRVFFCKMASQTFATSENFTPFVFERIKVSFWVEKVSLDFRKGESSWYIREDKIHLPQRLRFSLFSAAEITY